MSVSLPIVNLYHFYVNIYNLLNMDKYARMTKGIAVKELVTRQCNEKYNEFEK